MAAPERVRPREGQAEQVVTLAPERRQRRAASPLVTASVAVSEELVESPAEEQGFVLDNTSAPTDVAAPAGADHKQKEPAHDHHRQY